MQSNVFSLFRASISVLLGLAFSVAQAQTVKWELDPGVLTKGDAHYAITGVSGGDDLIALRLSLTPACAGKKISLSADYKSTGVAGGTKPFHGIHFDYEITAGGRQSWAPSFKAAPADDWRPLQREWSLPANMTDGMVRVGLQGVDGVLEVRNLKIVACQ